MVYWFCLPGYSCILGWKGLVWTGSMSRDICKNWHQISQRLEISALWVWGRENIPVECLGSSHCSDFGRTQLQCDTWLRWLDLLASGLRDGGAEVAIFEILAGKSSLCAPTGHLAATCNSSKCWTTWTNLPSGQWRFRCHQLSIWIWSQVAMSQYPLVN